MAIPSLEINYAQPSQPTNVGIDDVIAIAGPVGTGGSATANTIYRGDSLTDFFDAANSVNIVGSNGSVFEALTDFFGQSTATVLFTMYAAGADDAAKIAAWTNIVENYGAHRPTLFLVPGNEASDGAAGSANAVLTAIENLAANLYARVVNSVQYDGADQAAVIANAVTWAGNNSHPHVWNVFNSGSGEFPAGLFLGAAEDTAASSSVGRLAGVQLMPVRGGGTLRYNITQESAALAQLDDAGICTIINTPSGHRAVGGSFGYTTADSRREWPVARITDHLSVLIQQYWRDNLINSTASSSQLAVQLRDAGAVMITSGELTALRVYNLLRHSAGNTTVNVAASYIHPVTGLTVTLYLQPDLPTGGA